MTERTDPGAGPAGRSDLADVLRGALSAQADAVEVGPDALGEIRRRIARRRARWWLPRISLGGAVFTVSTGTAIAAGAAVVAVLAGTVRCAPPPAPLPPAGSTAPATATPERTPPDTQPSQTPAPAGSANLAIYYIGTGNRLFREFHVLPVGDGSPGARVRAAVTEMLDGRTARDPDYHSSWPASTAVRAASVTGTAITVDLSGASVNGYDPPTEQAALQQLIWTATAVVPGATLTLLLDGQPVTRLWNLIPISGPLARGPSLEVLAPIWVIDPQQGATVGGTVTVLVDGIAFEARAVVRIRDASGAVVREQPIDVGSYGVPARGTATVTLTLAPGRYTVQGFVFSARDGSVQDLDDHQFTVR